MKRRIVMVLVAGILVGSASAGLADEKKDHICFRTLDADKDGRVTFQEFEKSFG